MQITYVNYMVKGYIYLGTLHVTQCISVMRVAGPAVLSFGAVIARTSCTNRAGVWICRPTHTKIKRF